MTFSLLRRSGVPRGHAAPAHSRFFLRKADASDPPANGPAGSSGEPPAGGPEDDWKTRWALYFFLGVILAALLYFLVIAFSI